MALLTRTRPGGQDASNGTQLFKRYKLKEGALPHLRYGIGVGVVRVDAVVTQRCIAGVIQCWCGLFVVLGCVIVVYLAVVVGLGVGIMRVLVL